MTRDEAEKVLAQEGRLRELAREFFMPLEFNRVFLERVDMERRNPSLTVTGEDFDAAFKRYAARSERPDLKKAREG